MLPAALGTTRTVNEFEQRMKTVEATAETEWKGRMEAVEWKCCFKWCLWSFGVLNRSSSQKEWDFLCIVFDCGLKPLNTHSWKYWSREYSKCPSFWGYNKLRPKNGGRCPSPFHHCSGQLLPGDPRVEAAASRAWKTRKGRDWSHGADPSGKGFCKEKGECTIVDYEKERVCDCVSALAGLSCFGSKVWTIFELIQSLQPDDRIIWCYFFYRCLLIVCRFCPFAIGLNHAVCLGPSFRPSELFWLLV